MRRRVTNVWRVARAGLMAAVAVATAAPVSAQTGPGSAFIHQGVLSDGGAAATGLYDFQVTLFDAPSGGNQVGTPPTVTREDVPVASGVYLLNLDFGPGAFAGQRRWLAIAIRSGASTGTFTPISPRREVLPAPVAIQADTADAVAGVACAPGQLLVWTGAGWGCRADAVGTGTVRSVTAGPGLTANGVPGGTITTTGTMAIANGGITEPMIGTAVVNASKIAPGAVGMSHIQSGLVQERLAAPCADGSYLTIRAVRLSPSVVQNGTPQCERAIVLPSRATVTTSVHPTSTALALALAPDGLPVVAYHDTQGSVRVARCGDAYCSSVVSDVVVGAAPPWGGVAMVMPADGRPIVAFGRADFPAPLALIRCGDAGCTSGNQSLVHGVTPALVTLPALALRPGGLPVVAYVTLEPTPFLKLRVCITPDCTTSNDVTIEPATHVSLTVGADGVPLAAFTTANGAKVLHCGDPTCSAGRRTLPLGATRTRPSVAIAATGAPLITYHDTATGVRGLGFWRCGNATCTASSVVDTLDSSPAGALGDPSVIAVASTGQPWIAYRSEIGPALELTRCTAFHCFERDVFLTLDGTNDVGRGLAMVLAPSGAPIVAYLDRTAGAIRLVRCGTASCQ